MDKHEVALILEEIGILLELQGENPFKARAYHNAAHALENLDEELELVVNEERLKNIPGIGEAIAEKITTLVLKGKLPYYEKLKASIPEGLFKLLDVPALGPKKIKRLYDELGIKTVEELLDACEKGEVSQISGFGPKAEENLLKNIGKLKEYGRKTLWWEAGKLAYPIAAKLSKLKEVDQVEIAGSFRRKVETVRDLDFIVASSNPDPIMDWFTQQPLVDAIQAKGKTKSSVRLKKGIQADLRIVPKEEFPYALLYFTGSKEFNIQLRQRANRMGLTLNEYGLKPLKDQRKKIAICKDEEAIFKELKLNYIPPELREGHLEIEAAEKGTLPQLVEDSDIRGAFHCHTTQSDGHNTLEEMTMAACELGWEYLGISDHSKSSYQANGMDEERLFSQLKQIKKINQSGKFSTHLFAGIECDILIDGSLDFSNDVLKELDFVITSIHRSFNLKEKEMTARLIKAIENPYTTMVGHISGRLLLRRDPYALNLPKVIDACIANHKIIELNAQPHRLDMDWRFWHQSVEKGLKCSINPDAHSISDLKYYSAGVNIARKGWLEKQDILNTFSLAKVKKYLARKSSL